MTSLDKRREEYEDALFGVLMQHAMDAEGSALRIHNERCKQEAQPITAETDARCREAIDAGFAARRQEQRSRKRAKVFRTLLIAAIVFTMLFSTVYASVPAVQEKVDEIRAYMSGESLRFFVKSEKEEQLQEDYVNLRGYWMPKPVGFTLMRVDANWYYESAIFEAGEEAIIYSVSDGSGTYFVNDGVVKTEHIAGYDVTIIDYPNRENSVIYIPDNANQMLIEIRGENVNPERLKGLLNNVVFLGQSESMAATDPVWCGAIPSLTEQFELCEKRDTYNTAYRLYENGDQRLEVSLDYDIGDRGFGLTIPLGAIGVHFNLLRGYMLSNDEGVVFCAHDEDYRVFLEITGQNVDERLIQEFVRGMKISYMSSYSEEIERVSQLPEYLLRDWDMDLVFPQCIDGIFSYGSMANVGFKKGYLLKDSWVVLGAHTSVMDMMAFADAFDGEPVTINGNDGYYLKRPNGEYIITFDAERKVYLEVLTIGKPGQNIYDLAEEFRFREE